MHDQRRTLLIVVNVGLNFTPLFYIPIFFHFFHFWLILNRGILRTNS